MDKLATKRKANFTTNEIQVLVDEVEAHKNLLFSSFKDVSSSKIKKAKWEEIALKVHTVSSLGHKRSGEEVRTKWSKYQSLVKLKASKLKRYALKTGGGGPPKDDDVLDDTDKKVLAVLGKTGLEGIDGGIDLAEAAASSARPVPAAAIPEESVASTSGLAAQHTTTQYQPHSATQAYQKKRDESFSKQLLDVEKQSLVLLRQLVKINEEKLQVEKERLAEEKGRRYMEEERLNIAKETLELKKQKKK